MSEKGSILLASKIVEGLKKAGESLGPGYLHLATKYSVDLFAKKSGVEPPEIKDLDQALDYASKNMKAFINGYAAFAYGAMKAESTVTGASGSITRLVAKHATAQMLEATGLGKVLGKASTSSEALTKYLATLVKMGSVKQEDQKFTGSDGVLNVQIDNCPYVDACSAAVAEGIPKILGGHECVRILAFAAGIEAMTGKQQDYKLVSLSPPKCSGTIMEP
jgi:hypothetical protein